MVAPQGNNTSQVLLACAVCTEQIAHIGNQTGDRVFLFFYTDDFWRDFNFYKSKGIFFVREPKEERYGIVAVFRDLYGNLWDLLNLRPNTSVFNRTCDVGESDSLTKLNGFRWDCRRDDRQPPEFRLAELTLRTAEPIAEAQTDSSGTTHRYSFVPLRVVCIELGPRVG